jgi:hypothetical protein
VNLGHISPDKMNHKFRESHPEELWIPKDVSRVFHLKEFRDYWSQHFCITDKEMKPREKQWLFWSHTYQVSGKTETKGQVCELLIVYIHHSRNLLEIIFIPKLKIFSIQNKSVSDF